MIAAVAETVGGVVLGIFAVLIAAVIRRLIVHAEQIAELRERIGTIEGRLNGPRRARR